ncbi:MAG: TIGR02530 family flagellar biosynthesis protein [Oscillospiraceae bacterium]
MNDINLRKTLSAISTGKIQHYGNAPYSNKPKEVSTSFNDILKNQLDKDLNFSNHATNRAKERNIILSSKDIDRLNEGVQIAKDKGLDQTLILMDKNAFIVSAKNNMVITTIGENDLKGNVITNIQGTVII